jgi:3-hydroxyisobutyrate dehydrogenase
LGRPRYFAPAVEAGAVVKLIGQHLVFNGCSGITAGAGICAAALFDGELAGAGQSDFFDFLNGGAGGTRQWDVALSKGLRDNIWDQGFLVKHAVVDAVYAAKLALDLKLPRIVLEPMLNIAAGFSFLLARYPERELATHALARELTPAAAPAFDEFFSRCRISADNGQQALERIIASLPENVRRTVLLDIRTADFERY